MHMYLIASSIKIINKCNVLPCKDLSQPGLFHIETCISALGLWLDNTVAAKIIIKHIGW